MKRLKNILIILTIVFMAFALVACSDDPTEANEDPAEVPGGAEPAVPPSGTPSGTDDATVSPVFPRDAIKDGYSIVGDGTVSGEFYKESGVAPDGSESNEEKVPAGQITASAWDDNLHYDEWVKLFEKEDEQTQKEAGKFADFTGENGWGFDSLNRVTIKVSGFGAPAVGATVIFYEEDQTEVCAVTDATGTAYIFPKAEEGNITVKSGEYSETGHFDAENREVEIILSPTQKDSVIKLMFVVDVTGSMGDELKYVKAELTDVIKRVADANQGARIDLAFLFYRDEEDEEEFAYFDFVTVNDEQNLKAMLDRIDYQEATGGGDLPEAVDEALEIAVGKDWGEENSTKIIFHVLDAPAHSKKENMLRFEKAVKLAAKKGIRMCPVMCSGADVVCEYTVRNEALYTGGTFVFVTDDSGIGNSHYDPDLPDAVVEKLNDMMVRLINGYYTGTFAEPVPWHAEEQSVERQ